MGSADLIVRNASELLVGHPGGGGIRGSDLGHLSLIENGALAIVDGRIAAVAESDEIDARWRAPQVIDAAGNLVSPGLIDSHSHLIHAGTRHLEWQAKVLEQPANGLASGIRTTVRSTREATTGALEAGAMTFLDQALANGTTTLESKSGYGLDALTELRILRLMTELDKAHPIDLFPTFLGAHVLPPEYESDRSGYINLVIDLLDRAVEHARYCDLACDPSCFTAAECERIARRAVELGMRLRFHADQTGRAGGTALAVEFGASSVDHLECANDEDIARLAGSETVGVLLPGVTYHLMHHTPSALGSGPTKAAMAPETVRRMVDAGCCIALATDFNPGTCPTISMQAVMQLAARIYRLSYAEIWNMVTVNAAVALDCESERGSLGEGMLADLVIWQVPEHGMVINRFGVNQVATVIKAGKIVRPEKPVI